jgi:hypothetical protein
MISDIVAFLLSDTAAWSWTQCAALFVAAMLALEFISFRTRLEISADAYTPLYRIVRYPQYFIFLSATH